MRRRATTRSSSRRSARRSAGARRWRVSTRTSSCAGTRTSSSTVASATSGSSTPAASACRTSTSPARTGPSSTGWTSSCAAPRARHPTCPNGPASGLRRRRRRQPSTSRSSRVSADNVVVGRVGKSHGLDGSFVVEDASETRELFALGAKLLADGEEATVVGSKQARGRPVIRIDRRVARGTSLEVPRGALAPTGEDEYYVFQLVGLEAAEQGGPVLGTVADVTPGVENDVLELDSGLLLPMVEECVLSVDLDAGQIVVAPGFRDAG